MNAPNKKKSSAETQFICKYDGRAYVYSSTDSSFCQPHHSEFLQRCGLGAAGKPYIYNTTKCGSTASVKRSKPPLRAQAGGGLKASADSSGVAVALLLVRI